MGTCWCVKARHQSIDKGGLPAKPQVVVPEIQIWTSSTSADDFGPRTTSEPNEKKQSNSVSGSDAGYEGTMSCRSSLPQDPSHDIFQNAPDSTDSSLSYYTAPSNCLLKNVEEENNLLRKEVAHYKEESHQLRKKLADMETNLMQLNKSLQRKKAGNTAASGTPVSDRVAQNLARRTPKWKFLARDLKLQDHEIESISGNYPQDVEEQCYQMLKKWKQMNGNNADCATLGEALKKNFGEQLYSDYLALMQSEN